MSGGVDSTASALILSRRHRVEGFFMRLPHRRGAEQEERVRRLARNLDLPLHVIDLSEQFEEFVLSPFTDEYFSGRTPNPCMICNPTIKFGLLQERVLAQGLAAMATGHYARLVLDGPRPRLFRGVDRRKDQSYFLSRLCAEQLARTCFPLGDQDKEQTYRLVEDHGFSDFRGLESQDVCFLDPGELGDFLARRYGSDPVGGPIVDTSGKVLGRHRGLFRHTIGQRRGLGLAAPYPLYVIALHHDTNTVVVGEDRELYSNLVMVRDWLWLAGTPPQQGRPLTVCIRSTHKGAEAVLQPAAAGGGIRFSEPQRAVTPGQYAVVYDGDELLGSAVIVGAATQP